MASGTVEKYDAEVYPSEILTLYNDLEGVDYAINYIVQNHHFLQILIIYLCFEGINYTLFYEPFFFQNRSGIFLFLESKNGTKFA